TYAGCIPDDPSTHPWYENLKKIDLHPGTRKKKLVKFVTPLLHWLAKAPTVDQPLRSFLDFQQTIATAYDDVFPEHRFFAFYDKTSDEHKQTIAERCPGLTEAIKELNNFDQTSGLHRLPE